MSALRFVLASLDNPLLDRHCRNVSFVEKPHSTDISLDVVYAGNDATYDQLKSITSMSIYRLARVKPEGAHYNVRVLQLNLEAMETVSSDRIIARQTDNNSVADMYATATPLVRLTMKRSAEILDLLIRQVRAVDPYIVEPHINVRFTGRILSPKVFDGIKGYWYPARNSRLRIGTRVVVDIRTVLMEDGVPQQSYCDSTSGMVEANITSEGIVLRDGPRLTESSKRNGLYVGPDGTGYYVDSMYQHQVDGDMLEA